MKSFVKVSLVAIILVAMVFAMTTAIWAEDPEHSAQIIEEKAYETFSEYHYPSGNRMFYLPRHHEVKFDIHNGKFFQIAYFPYHSWSVPDAEEESYADFTVYFYTPDGKLFGIRKLSRLDTNRYYSIPHGDRSPNCERLIIKIQNNCEFNKDFVFKVLDPADAVRGTPIKNVNFRLIFH